MDAARILMEENAPEKKLYAWDDIIALPDGRRAELINGQWFEMATPNARHQEIVMIVAGELREHIKKKGGDCKIFPAPFAVFLTENIHNWLEPDISVVCDRDKIKEDGCHGAPDLVVEVTSPSTLKRDISKKLFMYRTEGVREYWIINPDTGTITLYAFDADDEKTDGDQITFGDELKSRIYPDFSIRLADYL